jgi:SAM-dependent methyltransferase
MTWKEHTAAWSRPPVDDVGYLPSADMMTLSDLDLMTVIRDMAQTRYGGWRNHGGLWREVLKLDDTHGKDVLDFGCGVGMEARELQEAGNRVSLADISPDNLALAYRVLSLGDHVPETITCHLVEDFPPYFTSDPASFDVIHCAGVLHHIPWAREIMQRFHEVLRPGGEVRLMLYSDKGWTLATGDPAPHWSERPDSQPGFTKFVRFFDGVGEYADCYSEDKISFFFSRWFNVEEFAYLTEDYRYCAAVLSKKEGS